MITELLGKLVHVPSVVPQSCAGAVAGDYVSLKNFNRCVILIALGAINTSVTIQLRQAKDVSGTGVKALNFTAVTRQGGELGISSATGTFTVGETVTGGTSGATGVVFEDHGTHLLVHTITGTFQVETITGGTSGFTATSTVIANVGRKMRVPLTAANTVALTNGSECYEIEVDPATLDVDNGFDTIMADVSAVAGGAGLASVSYLLASKYAEDAQLSPLVN